jgi:phosphatidate phosphatase APP1
MARWKTRLRRLWGDPLAIHAYAGYGSRRRVWLRGRVLDDEGLQPADERAGVWRNLRDAWKRFETDERAGVRVRAAAHGAQAEAVTDREGYFEVTLETPAPLPAEREWHDVALTAFHGDTPVASATGRVLAPAEAARVAVISDIDDTIVQTGATQWLRAARGVLLGNAYTRLPFPGVAPFYRALRVGGDGGAANPFFYVSSSPWNLYDLLAEFMDLNAIPVGPLLLRDWGITPQSVLPTDHRSHKLAHIRQIMDSYPLPFILIGDSGQRDPEIYREVVAEYPARILAIYIRSVSPDPLRRETVRALAREVERAGSALLLTDDTLSAARHAADNGWISSEAVAAVADDPDVRAARAEPDSAPDVRID